MSGIQFISEDPVGRGYDAQLARNVRTRQEQERVGVDAALRQGIDDMLTRASPQTSSPADYIAPLSSGSTGVAAPPQRIDTSDSAQDDYAVRTMLAEDGKSPEGMAGVGHVIRNRLLSGKWGGDIGSVVLAPSQFTPWNPGSGNDPRRFNPQSPEYQAALAQWQRIKSGQEPDPTGGALHFANPAASTAAWVQPAVASGNFTQIGGHHFFRGLDVGVPAGPGSAMPDYAAAVTTAAMPAPQQRQRFDYEPILQRLAATPGGGRVALPLMTQANRQDIALGRRTDQYTKLVGQALINGNPQAAEYYAKLAGVPLPPQLLADTGAMKRTGIALKLTQRFYANDQQRAAAFAQAYVRTGSIDQAFQLAGPPQDNPQLSLQWLRDGERETLYGVDRRMGTAAPITMAPSAGGQPPAPDGAAPAPASPAQGSGYQPPQPGAPVTRDARGGGRGGALGRASVWEMKVQAMRDGGMNEAQIAEVAAGKQGKPIGMQTIVALRNALAREAQADLSLDTPEKRQAYVDQGMSSMIPNWRALMNQATTPGGRAPASAYPPIGEGYSGRASTAAPSATGAQAPAPSTAFAAPQPAPAAPQAPAAPTVAPPRAVAPRTPSKASIDALRANPWRRQEFDAMFGPGASARYIGNEAGGP